MVPLGQLLAFAKISEDSPSRSYSMFLHQGKQVCVRTFRFLHRVGEKRFKNLVKSVKENGLTPRTHGNSWRRQHNAFSSTSIEYVVRFLHTYTEQNGLLLPGRIPGYSRTDIKLLPSSTSKRAIWKVYSSAAADEDEIHVVGYSTFCKLWKQLVHHEAHVGSVCTVSAKQQRHSQGSQRSRLREDCSYHQSCRRTSAHRPARAVLLQNHVWHLQEESW